MTQTIKTNAVKGGRGASSSCIDIIHKSIGTIRAECQYQTKIGSISVGLESERIKAPNVYFNIDLSDRIHARSSEANSFQISASIGKNIRLPAFSQPNPAIFCGRTLNVIASTSRNLTKRANSTKLVARGRGYSLLCVGNHAGIGPELNTELGIKWDSGQTAKTASTLFVKSDIGFSVNRISQPISEEVLSFNDKLHNKLVELSMLAYRGNKQVLVDFIREVADTDVDVESAARNLMTCVEKSITKNPEAFNSLYSNELTEYAYAERFVKAVRQSQGILDSYYQDLASGDRSTDNTCEEETIISSIHYIINTSIALATGGTEGEIAEDFIGYNNLARYNVKFQNVNLNKRDFKLKNMSEPAMKPMNTLVSTKVVNKNILNSEWLLLRKQAPAENKVLPVASISIAPAPPFFTVSSVCIVSFSLLGYRLLPWFRKKTIEP